MMATSSANASSIVLPEGVTCSDLFWATSGRLNPTELSDRQKCILATTSEEDSGSMGDLLWVRIDGEYFSTSKRKLWVMFKDEDKARKALQIEFIRQHAEWKAAQNG